MILMLSTHSPLGPSSTSPESESNICKRIEMTRTCVKSLDRNICAPISDVVRKGHGGQLPPNCRLAPKQLHLKKKLTSFATNVQPECHKFTIGAQTNCFCSLHSQHCFVPQFSQWRCQWLRWLVEYDDHKYCPQILVAPNRHSLAMCLFPRSLSL